MIKFCKELGMTPAETQKKLKLSENHRNVSRALEYKWHIDTRMDIEETKHGKKGRRKEIDDNVVKIINDTICDDDVGQYGRWTKCWGSANHPFIAYYLNI